LLALQRRANCTECRPDRRALHGWRSCGTFLAL
jgi:hypothetical protein